MLRLGPDTAGRTASVEVHAVNGALEIFMTAEAPPVRGVLPAYPEWYFRRHFVVFLNPGHDHATRWTYTVDDAGQVTGKSEWVLPGEESQDTGTAALPKPPEARGSFEHLDERRFSIRLTVPVAAEWNDPAQPLGLAVKVGFHEECIPFPLQWPAPQLWGKDTPLLFGDLYLRDPVLHVEELTFEKPAWGGAASALRLRAQVASGAPRAGTLRLLTVLPGDSEQPQPGTHWNAQDGALDLRAPVLFPHRGKWSPDSKGIAQLRVELRDLKDEALWRGTFPFGFDAGIIIREIYGPRGRPLPDRPAPTAPDFVERFRAYVLARMPDYQPRTTREGAPSDFYLEDRNAEAPLDLSADGALERVAAQLVERFPDWQDALCAAALWVYHPSITRHSSAWSRAAWVSTTESIPRLGGCFCGDSARLLGRLSERIGVRAKEPLQSLHLGLRGHITTLVATPIGRVVIDGMLGLWFHTLDNRRLATLEEMRAEAKIAGRMWYCPRGNGHEFFHGVHDQVIRNFEEGPALWPDGSNPES